RLRDPRPVGPVIGGLSPPAFAALAALIALAAAIHRLGGQGFGTVAAPFTAILAPDHVPATVLLLGVVVTARGLSLDFREARGREIAPAVLGRLVGTAPAVWIVGAVAGSPWLGVAVASMILLAVALSLAGLRAPKTRGTLFAAGWLSGFMGTLTSVGAAPMGLIYQAEAAKRARGTLNAYFLLGVLFSVGGLAIAGLIRAEHLIATAALAPAVLFGVWAAGPLARRTEAAPIRPIALGLASAAALFLLWRSLS
ncbi:MAG: sulfite exporter TauE/SafE family protein, partial [Pseudomonadota bacterium]